MPRGSGPRAPGLASNFFFPKETHTVLGNTRTQGCVKAAEDRVIAVGRSSLTDCVLVDLGVGEPYEVSQPAGHSD